MNDIVRTLKIDAAIADIWPYLIESDKISQWLMPNTFEAEEGHTFTMDCPPGIGSGAPVECEIKELVQPSAGRARLVYTWVIDSPYTETLLEIDLMEVSGVTTLDLVHSGWDEGGNDLRTRHAMGWDHLLGTVLRGLLSA
jgi:uncharacterized protein YndB with AHSA1/START domain